MKDLITIGDSSVDLYMKLEGDSVIDELDETTPKICFNHGSKIPVEHFETTVAGNALNVAVGIKTLGLDSAVYTEIGDDQNANDIINELEKRSIDSSMVIKNKKTLTDVHTVIVYKGDRTIFSYHGKRTYSLDKLVKSKWIYYTSMGEGFKDFQKELITYLKKNELTGLAVNPGTIQMKYGYDGIKEILEYTDVLILNKEEAEKLALFEFSDIENLHKKLKSYGPKLIVITDGIRGASAYNGENIETHEIYSDSRPLLDRTGSGDAFSSGFMSAIIYGKSIKEALRWGIINSGNVIKVIGAINGLTSKKEMEEIIQKKFM